MSSHFIYQFPPLLPGILIKRYKRFFADIELATGELITAHCPNTGPMTGVSTPGSLVQVSYNPSPTRKLAYTWEMIQVTDNEPTWVGINTNLPNRIVKLGLEAGIFAELRDYQQIKPEVVYGQDKKSRIDFLLSGSEVNLPAYLEVKNTTWSQGRLAVFPDTVTTRGQKHLRELMALLPTKRSIMLYFINRGDCNSFAPGDIVDPVYGKMLREAVRQGVEVLAYRFETTPEGICYLGKANFIPSMAELSVNSANSYR
ncbi:sugar fermentation stimulation protein SfsA [[Phormidium ambiguum] IAM M-71]|uniref:Sugar fermentation stimulation protein homolog n=1 Tax=[Phormidium ambiguum] IAM M-71 TaxID=454136 RepID=A0A1U7IRZ4_9CYAN|nr:DNA/RNA nuclease SfsA [Phormidium ambiguum]OKH40163.1 sugar fermentation stimulation protein SfsA [Phormidium ambiguum IAM M-71]